MGLTGPRGDRESAKKQRRGQTRHWRRGVKKKEGMGTVKKERGNDGWEKSETQQGGSRHVAEHEWKNKLPVIGHHLRERNPTGITSMHTDTHAHARTHNFPPGLEQSGNKSDAFANRRNLINPSDNSSN